MNLTLAFDVIMLYWVTINVLALLGYTLHIKVRNRRQAGGRTQLAPSCRRGAGHRENRRPPFPQPPSTRGGPFWRITMSKLARTLCTLTALLLIPLPALAEKLTLTGSTTLAPMIKELAKRFAATHPGVEFVVEGGGSGRGAADALAGKSDIGMVSRNLHADEKSLFVFTVARDGVAMVVHRDNPVKALSRAQVIDLLSGKTSNWKAAGGADAPVRVCTRGAGRGSMEVISHYFGLSPEAIKAQCVAGDNVDAVRAVIEDRNTLIMLSVGVVEDSLEKNLPLRALDVEGAAARSATVRNGSYPLARPLNLVTRSVPKGAARDFIEFVQSSRAREVIAEYDFVPYGH